MSEILDVVDEFDIVVGNATKREVHDNKLLHRGAAILLFKDDTCEEILIQQRGFNHRCNPGKWNQIGGHISKGKSYLEGAFKELKEEMFFESSMPDITLMELFKFRKSADDDFEFMTVFKAVYDGEFSLQPEEVVDFKFVNFKDLVLDLDEHSDNYTETFKAIISEYQKNFSKIV